MSDDIILNVLTFIFVLCAREHYFKYGITNLVHSFVNNFALLEGKLIEVQSLTVRDLL